MSKCGQGHVVSICKKLYTDLLSDKTNTQSERLCHINKRGCGNEQFIRKSKAHHFSNFRRFCPQRSSRNSTEEPTDSSNNNSSCGKTKCCTAFFIQTSAAKSASHLNAGKIKYNEHVRQQNNPTNQTPVLRPLYRSTCVSRHLQLRTGWFCWLQSFTVHMPLLMATSAIGLGEETLEFSSVVLSTLSPYVRQWNKIGQLYDREMKWPLYNENVKLPCQSCVSSGLQERCSWTHTASCQRILESSSAAVLSKNSNT